MRDLYEEIDKGLSAEESRLKVMEIRSESI